MKSERALSLNNMIQNTSLGFASQESGLMALLLILLAVTLCSLFMLVIHSSLKRQGHSFPWQFFLLTLGIFSSGVLWNVGQVYFDWFIVTTVICLITFPKNNLPTIYLSMKNLQINILFGFLLTGLLILVGRYATGLVVGCPMPLERIGVVVYVILVSACEEIYIRGFVLGHLIFVNIDSLRANIYQSVFFALIHVSYILNGQYHFLLFTLMFGFLAGYITLEHKNISGAVTAHILINLIACTI